MLEHLAWGAAGESQAMLVVRRGRIRTLRQALLLVHMQARYGPCANGHRRKRPGDRQIALRQSADKVLQQVERVYGPNHRIAQGIRRGIERRREEERREGGPLSRIALLSTASIDVCGSADGLVRSKRLVKPVSDARPAMKSSCRIPGFES
jgi:hypothetical protein